MRLRPRGPQARAEPRLGTCRPDRRDQGQGCFEHPPPSARQGLDQVSHIAGEIDRHEVGRKRQTQPLGEDEWHHAAAFPGLGAGARDPGSHANVLRLLVGAATGPTTTDGALLSNGP